MTGDSLFLKSLKHFILQHKAIRRLGSHGGSGASQSVQALFARPSGNQRWCFHCDMASGILEEIFLVKIWKENYAIPVKNTQLIT